MSTLLEGEHGEEGIFCGVPVVLNRIGAFDVLEILMQEDELKKFKKSANVY